MAAFKSTGMSDEHARTAAECLVTTDARGIRSHGLVRLPNYIEALQRRLIDPLAEPIATVDGPSTAVLDGRNGIGLVVASKAMALAASKARMTGVGCVAVGHSNHLGACGYYSSLAASQGLIGLAMTNSSAAMAPWGGVQRLIGANPLSIAVPGGAAGNDIMLDIAMTAAARGKVKLAEAANSKLPVGWAIDSEGQPTIEPSAALLGAMLPFGEHKGYGLAVMIDILCAGLGEGLFSPELENPGFARPANFSVMRRITPKGAGVAHLMIALDVGRFVELRRFTRRVRAYGRSVRASVGLVHLPGDRENDEYRRSVDEGIVYDPSILGQLRSLSDSIGLQFPAPMPDVRPS